NRTLRRRRRCTGGCLCGPVLLVFIDRIVLARRSRRPAGQALEDACEMALVRETGLDRDLGERPLLAEQLLRPPHATLGHVCPRRDSLDLAEDALEVR